MAVHYLAGSVGKAEREKQNEREGPTDGMENTRGRRGERYGNHTPR